MSGTIGTSSRTTQSVVMETAIGFLITLVDHWITTVQIEISEVNVWIVSLAYAVCWFYGFVINFPK